MTDLRALLANATLRLPLYVSDAEYDRGVEYRHVYDADNSGEFEATYLSPAHAALIVALVNAADELVAVTEAARGMRLALDAVNESQGDDAAMAAFSLTVANLDAALAALDARLAEENK